MITKYAGFIIRVILLIILLPVTILFIYGELYLAYYHIFSIKYQIYFGIILLGLYLTLKWNSNAGKEKKVEKNLPKKK